jgi:hypothetical protein
VEARMTTDQMNVRPPRWAETMLRLALRDHDRETVSGDLLEEYRESVRPSRGAAAADMWYIRQVAGFLWRATWAWALLFSGAFVARQAYDMFVPTNDFMLRSEVTTYTAVAILVLVAFWAAWRSASFVAGVVSTVLMTQLAAVFSVAGASMLLAIWHDPDTMSAIAGSGGIEEMYVLPFMAIVPAIIIGTVGAAAGILSRGILGASAHRAR